MKQWIAVLLLIAYSLTSIGAPVAMDQCGPQQQHRAHHAQADCVHVTFNPLHCSSNNQQVCSLAGENNSVEIAAFKELAKPYKFLPAAFDAKPTGTEAPVRFSLKNSDGSQTLYKIRLYLFKRVLLI